MSDALDTEPLVTTVGPQTSSFFDIPFEFELLAGWSVRSAEYIAIAGEWQTLRDAGFVPSGTPSSFAEFTVVPEPGTTLSLVVALATLGVVGRWRRGRSEATVVHGR